MAPGHRLLFGLLAARVGKTDAGGATTWTPVRPLVDNFRDVQPINPETRTIYRSAAASGSCTTACDTSSSACEGDGATDTHRFLATTLERSWQYADQQHWGDFTNGDTWATECFVENKFGTYPGESPINFEPSEVTASSDPKITLKGNYSAPRRGLPFSNNGHS